MKVRTLGQGAVKRERYGARERDREGVVLFCLRRAREKIGKRLYSHPFLVSFPTSQMLSQTLALFLKQRGRGGPKSIQKYAYKQPNELCKSYFSHSNLRCVMQEMTGSRTPQLDSHIYIQMQSLSYVLQSKCILYFTFSKTGS